MQAREFQPGVIQPGMERIVESGETLEITDKDGQVFAVTCTEGPEVMAFLTSFDNWKTMRDNAISGDVMRLQWNDLIDKFNRLPMRVQRALPSFKTLGIGV
jgi:hypothetical protein